MRGTRTTRASTKNAAVIEALRVAGTTTMSQVEQLAWALRRRPGGRACYASVARYWWSPLFPSALV